MSTVENVKFWFETCASVQLTKLYVTLKSPQKLKLPQLSMFFCHFLSLMFLSLSKAQRSIVYCAFSFLE